MSDRGGIKMGIALWAVIGSMTCAIIGITGLIKYLLKQQQIKHKEKMVMIEKGIYVEARRQESGVPSFGIIILVGIGLAVLAANQHAFLGFALLFIGIGLIIRDRLLRHKKQTSGLLQTERLSTKNPKQLGEKPGDERL